MKRITCVCAGEVLFTEMVAETLSISANFLVSRCAERAEIEPETVSKEECNEGEIHD
jgi:hypothetical protein